MLSRVYVQEKEYVSGYDNERITLGNKAYYANQLFFKSSLVSKKSKLKLYWSIKRPTVTYSCETWGFEGTIKSKLTL
jgi:hypothetical protein